MHPKPSPSQLRAAWCLPISSVARLIVIKPHFYSTYSPTEYKYFPAKIRMFFEGSIFYSVWWLPFEQETARRTAVMATLRLGRFEARQGHLPPVCSRCGTAASVYRKKVFFYSPLWIYLGIPFGMVPFFILAWYRSKSAPVRVPLCSLHQNLWRWQQPVLITACSIVSVGFGLIPLALVFQGRYAADKEQKILVVASLAVLAGIYLYVGAMIALKYLGIHATEVTTSSVTLTGVAAEFVEALRVAHQGETSKQPNMGAPASQAMET